jgi:L-alanine-DL-glutamate epimerase-like enolase superfamily enzyme
MRGDGTTGVGEASPLPGYSDDELEQVLEELHALVDAPVEADPLGAPFDIVSEALGTTPARTPSARFAIETSLLDWLGHERGLALHRILAGDAERAPIPIAELVLAPRPEDWPARVDALVADGVTHVKLKVGTDVDSEVRALQEVREAHPSLRIRLDGNRRIPIEALRTHASKLERLELELFEEPSAPEDWVEALGFPLPWALDESLRDPELRAKLLDSGRICAVVLKPMVLGGLSASFALAEQAAEHDAGYLVSHTFDGPIARAATAELALALQTPLAAGLGEHPGLLLWTPHRIAAIDGRRIVSHDAPGLGLHFDVQGQDA